MASLDLYSAGGVVEMYCSSSNALLFSHEGEIHQPVGLKATFILSDGYFINCDSNFGLGED